jgi:dihydroorotate dehydrogenase electron transfer subunit
VDLVLTTEDGGMGERGRVTAPLEQRLASAGPHTPVMLYACGPEGMLAATAKIASRYGRQCQVSVERIMGCGLGGCYSCVVPMRNEEGGFHNVRSCLSGPVLAADQILWE